jgi:hypothetical protein
MTTKEKVDLRIMIKDFAMNRSGDSVSVKGLCGQLTTECELLNKAWSEMAVRNILGDLVRLLAKLEADKTLHAGYKTRCQEIKNEVAAKMGPHSPSKARYDKVVCVGFKIQCVGDKYSGKVDDAADMLDRCKNMKQAIQSGFALVDTMGNFNTDNKALKVFMAPEFYFRGRNGAYTHEVVHGREAQPDAQPLALPKVQGIMEVMREETDKLCYKDWLFVMGTAIAATELTETVCTVCNTKAKFVKIPNSQKTKPVCTKNPSHATSEKSLGAFVENVALIVKEKACHTITKELVASFDFDNAGVKDKVKIMGKGHDVYRAPQRSGRSAATNVPTKFQDERMGGCIFIIDGVTIGLEVCLDHWATRETDGGPGRLQHAANIQVQLIPSGGMNISSLRTLPGGIVFNVDGKTPHVEVIAGAAPEVRKSYPGVTSKYTGATWNALAAQGTDTPVLGTSVSPGRKYVGYAGSGTVLAFGPYDIPRG